MPTILSGVAPSGNLHIGNYIGALKQWISDQNSYNSLFCVVDLHAITVPQNPVALRKKTREVASLYLACGIDPEKAAIFVQSQNPDHTSLAWILNCFISYSTLKRMTQFKDKSEKQTEIISAGLFAYPSLMAADILLYQADFVPVGEDQKQHLELTRDVASRMNSKYGDLFIIPEAKILKSSAKRIMSLQNPNSKMSKSDENAMGAIFLLDPPDLISKKIKSAVTDSERDIKFNENRPGLANLLTIYSSLSNKTIAEIEKHYQEKGYKEFKEDLSGITIEFLKPIQEKYHKLDKNPDYLEQILKKGLEKARSISSQTLEKVEKTIGLGI